MKSSSTTTLAVVDNEENIVTLFT